MQSALRTSFSGGGASLARGGNGAQKSTREHRAPPPPSCSSSHTPSPSSSAIAPAALPSAGALACARRISISSSLPISRPLSNARPLRAAANNEPAAEAPSPAAGSAAAAAAEERRRGVKTVLAELNGLDMPRSEVLKYVRGSVRLPKRAPPAADGVPVSRAAEALEQIMIMAEGGAGSGVLLAASAQDGAAASRACDDARALAALNHLLTDLWRWKRRGGGSRWDEDDEATSPSAVALLELQGVDADGRQARAVAAAAAEQGGGGKAGSNGGGEGVGGFFDAGDLNEREKQELAGMMRGAAMAGVQNAFWGSLVLSAIVLLLLNFARGG